jgi:hypothetical protein
VNANPYRVEFHAKGDDEARGLPEPAFVALFETLVAVSRDPWATSGPEDSMGDPAFRWVSFDRDLGVVHFMINDDSRVIRVHGVTWTG